MRLLVVDDDPKYRAFVAKGLTESGLLVDTVPDGETALATLAETSYDLVLLDVMMPGLQGWDVLEALRERGVDVPVIWVTAREELDERIRGLRMGGDDYVVKPFHFAELLARIHAVMRRRGQRTKAQIGNLELDFLAGRVRRSGNTLDLTRTEFSLLRHLAEHAGETVGRTELLQKVWGMDFDPGTNIVDVHIRRLRKKVDDPYPPPLIHTVRGAGYVLEERP